MAFLVSAEGLSLDVAQDRRTEEALGRALPLLADMDLSHLAGRRLDADDFDRLSVADPVRDLLQWLNAPERFEQTQAGRWVAFRNRCESEFLIDPADGPDVAIRAIAEGHQALDPVWFRFCESPAAYPGIAKLLRSPATLAIDASRNPAINESDGADLKKALECISGLDQAAAAGEGAGSRSAAWAEALVGLGSHGAEPVGYGIGTSSRTRKAEQVTGGWSNSGCRRRGVLNRWLSLRPGSPRRTVPIP